MGHGEHESSAVWAALASRAAGPRRGDPSGRFASIAFVVTGIIQGAVHVPLSHGEDGAARALAFADALVDEAKREGHVLRVVWRAPTQGPHQGVVHEGLVCSFESLALPRGIDPLHITQTIDAARGTAEAAVLAIAERMGLLSELARAQLEELRRMSADASLVEFVRRAEAVQAGASAVLHELQFQDRTSQMLVHANEQATEVIRLAGLQERELTHAALHQVGRLGHELGAGTAPAVGGDVELF